MNENDTQDTEFDTAEAVENNDVSALLGRIKRLETDLKQTKNAKPLEVQTPQVDESRLERLELRTEGYTPEEVDHIMGFGGRKALENPIVKAGIEKLRFDNKLANAADVDSSTKSEIERKYTEAELMAMPTEELKKILPKANK